MLLILLGRLHCRRIWIIHDSVVLFFLFAATLEVLEAGLEDAATAASWHLRSHLTPAAANEYLSSADSSLYHSLFKACK